MKIRIGTRGSELALAQTALAAEAIRAAMPDAEIETVIIKTKGDRVIDRPLDQIGGKGLFISEIEHALTCGEIDMAVHSAKDLPPELADGTEIAAVLRRGDPRDMLVMREDISEQMLRDPTAHYRIGTGSARRISALRKKYPRSEFAGIRGNIDTRLQKLRDGEYDAIVLAAAGLERLHLTDTLPHTPLSAAWECIPAPCQGIIAIQARTGAFPALMQEICDEDTMYCFETERYILELMDAGCAAPVGAYASIQDGVIRVNLTNGHTKILSDAAKVSERFALAERIVQNLYGTVSLVGAGCGDAELITMRGAMLLRKCDAVVYDALIDKRLLRFAPRKAECIPVGKRAGQHSTPQDEINALLIRLAKEGRNVVRLKGGDPFVFGRGGEEAIALREAGIRYTVVPGISSCIAAPELAGIPVTHRQTSRSFTVITGHTAEGGIDTAKYAQTGGTLVFLMGLKALPEIAAGLMRGGMPADTPAAVISEGGTSRQVSVRGTLQDIAFLAAEMTPPAVIVVGDNAALDLAPTAQPLLHGKTFTVAGTPSFTEHITDALQQYGADVYPLPHIVPLPTGSLPPLTDYKCIVLTSRNGAQMFLDQLRYSAVDHRTLSGIRIAVIGKETASLLRVHGLYPDLMPENARSESLGEALVQDPPGRILLLRASNSSDTLPEILTQHGVPFDALTLYDTVPDETVPPQNISTDFLIFGSTYGVKSFFERGFTVSATTKIRCIGKRTVNAVRSFGYRAKAAPQSSADGLIQLLTQEARS